MIKGILILTLSFIITSCGESLDSSSLYINPGDVSIGEQSQNTQPEVTLSLEDIDFGVLGKDIVSGKQELVISNDSDEDIQACESVSLVGENADEFQIDNENCTSQDIAANSSCSVEVRAQVSGSGNKVASLQLNCQEQELSLPLEAEVSIYDAPSIGADQSDSVSEDGAVGLNINPASSNEGNTLSYAIVEGPANGTLSNCMDQSGSDNAQDLSCTYTPNVDFAGTDTFTYKVNDGLDSNEATVSLTVNNIDDKPVVPAAYTSANFDEDVQSIITLNYSDIENDLATSCAISAESNVSVTQACACDGGGVCTVGVTGTANYYGAGGFDYNVTANGQTSDANSISFAIHPVQDTPVATSESKSTAIDVALNDTLSASDADGDSLTYSIVSSASNGTVSITNAATGAFTYTPNLSYSGTDSFTFKVNDGYGDSNIAIVALNISPCPPNFLLVEENAEFSTSAFCVAKYEMRDNGSGVPVSVNTGAPMGITAASAFSKCAAKTISGFSGNFSLMSNDQWMAMAREIENKKENWSGGIVGSGFINRGYSASTNSFFSNDAFGNTTFAPNATDACLYNTGADTCGSTGSFLYKRTHELASGEEIWDVSGNHHEWVDISSIDLAYTGPSADCNQNGYREYIGTNGCGNIPYTKLGPFGNYNSSHGMGKGFLDDYGTNTGGFIRGFSYGTGLTGGIYAALFVSSTNSYGFRCVYDPGI